MGCGPTRLGRSPLVAGVGLVLAVTLLLFLPLPLVALPVLKVTITRPVADAKVNGQISVVTRIAGVTGGANVNLQVGNRQVDRAYTIGGGQVTLTWDTRLFADGPQTVKVTASDGAGRTASATVSVILINTGPWPPTLSVAFTAPAAGAVLSGSTTVSLTITGAAGSTTLGLMADSETIATVPVTGTTMSVPWNTVGSQNGSRTLRATVTDGQARTATVTRAVTVANLSASFTTPAAGTTVTGATTITVGVSGAIGSPVTLALAVDGAPLVAQVVTGTSASAPWNTAGLANGPRTLTATVTDGAGRTVTVSRTVTVANLSASFTAPGAGASVGGTVTVTLAADGAMGSPNTFALKVDGTPISTVSTAAATASIAWNTAGVANGARTLTATVTDGGGRTVTVGVAAAGALGSPTTFSLSVDGASIAAVTTAATTASIPWNTSSVASGARTLTVTVTDGGGRTATATRTVTVASMSLAFTTPNAGATVSGTVTVSVAADGTVGSSNTFALAVDGTPITTVSTAATSASISWNTTGVGNGAHTLTATVTDSAGRTATATRSVTVANSPPPTGSLDLRSLPDNTWLALAPTPSERFVCHSWTDCTPRRTMPNPIGRSYSGVVYGDGAIFYFGGGHGSHPGNDVEIYDIAANVWEQPLAPEGLPLICHVDPAADPACAIMSGGGTPTVTPLGRPYVEHQYQQNAYDPVHQRLIVGVNSGTWAYDRVSAQWTRLTTSLPPATDVHTKLMTYDPVLQSVLWFATTQWERAVFVFDYTTNQWLQRGQIPGEVSWHEIYSAFDSTQRKHLVSHATAGLWWYDSGADTWTRLTGVPPDLGFVSSLAYDSYNRIFLLAQEFGTPGTPITFWTFDGVASWTRLTPGNPWPRITASGGAPWNTLVFDPINEVFFLVNPLDVGGGGTGGINPGSVETWAYRYR